MQQPNLIYEVNLTVDKKIADEYCQWLNTHVQEMLQCDGFVSAQLMRIQEESPDKVQWRVQYTLEDEASLKTYLEKHAPAMRADGINRFGDKFQATRRIMIIEEAFD